MSGKQMTGAEMVLQALRDQEVDTIFGYPGGAVLPIYDALHQQNDIFHVLVRHEQGASHAAEGFARSTGKVGVMLVTSGPGATNVVTGLTDALMDSIPVVAICGQVPTHLIGSDAFQEADTTGITRSCTKHNYLVKDIADLPRILHEAFHVAREGRPGPVLVDLPKDVQFATGTYEGPETAVKVNYHPRRIPKDERIEQAIKLIKKAKKPLIYGGGGLVNSGPEASKLLMDFVDILDCPVTLTLMGLGAFPHSDKRYLGMVGMHGTYEANLAMHDCDLMINVGARFDDRVTGRLDAFAPNSRKIHIDIDPSSINKVVKVDVPIVGDCAESLKALVEAAKAEKIAPSKDANAKWWRQVEQWRAKDCLSYEQRDDVIMPQYAIERLIALTKDRDDVYVTTEVGQHQMWAAQFLPFEKPNRWMTSGGLGTMGYGLPSALGVQTAHPDALVIDVSGEASVMMNIQEVATCVQYNLPVKIFILNNEYMGMVRQWQELLHDSRYSQTYSEALPDFVKLAEAFGAVGIRAQTVDELDEKLQEMIDCPKPVIFDCVVHKEENCFPMIPSGAAHNEILLGRDHAAGDSKDFDEALV